MNKKITVILAIIGIVLVMFGIFAGKSIDLDYKEIGNINENKLAVTDGKKFGYYDIKKNTVKLIYDFPEDTDIITLKYKDGYAPYIENKKYGLIDGEGKVIVVASFDKVEILDSNLVKTLKNKKYSIMKISNSKEIMSGFDEIKQIGNTNYLILKAGDKTSIYDFKNTREIAGDIETTRFINNLNDEYVLSLDKENILKNYYINAKENELIELTGTENSTPMEIEDGLVSFIDSNKKYFTYELSSSKIKKYSGDYYYLSPTNNDLVLVANHEGLYGFINNNEDVVIPYKYQEGTTNFDKNGYAIVMENDMYGTIAKDGKTVIPIKYTHLQKLGNNYITIINQVKRSIIDKTGKNLSKEYPGIADNNNNDLLIVIDKNEKYGIIDRNGKIIVDTKYESIKSSDNYFIFRLSKKKYQIKDIKEIVKKN